MAHVFSQDFGSVNASEVVTSLDKVSSEASSFSSTISLFRSETVNTLVGPGYNSVRNKMSLYEDALSKAATISDNLKSNILAANNTLLNAMEGYGELNTADLPEIDTRLSRSKEILAILKSVVTVYKKDSEGKYILDSKGNKIVDYTYTVGSSTLITQYEGLIEQLEKLKEVLDKLEGNVANASSMLTDTVSDITIYTNLVSGITASVYQ